jgi:hypothetical protein
MTHDSCFSLAALSLGGKHSDGSKHSVTVGGYLLFNLQLIARSGLTLSLYTPSVNTRKAIITIGKAMMLSPKSTDITAQYRFRILCIS